MSETIGYRGTDTDAATERWVMGGKWSFGKDGGASSQSAN